MNLQVGTWSSVKSLAKMTVQISFPLHFLRAFSKQGTLSVSCGKMFRKKIHDTLSEPGGLGNKTMARTKTWGNNGGIDWLIVMQDQPTERLWEVHRGGILFWDLGLKTKPRGSRQLTWHSIGTPARMTKLESHEWKLFWKKQEFRIVKASQAFWAVWWVWWFCRCPEF